VKCKGKWESINGDIPSEVLWTGETLAIQRIDCDDVSGLKTTEQMKRTVMSYWYMAMMQTDSGGSMRCAGGVILDMARHC
jgi:hypothetical protein